jgi:hypothetical protein
VGEVTKRLIESVVDVSVGEPSMIGLEFLPADAG